jgi:type IV secretory pathway TrbL component
MSLPIGFFLWIEQTPLSLWVRESPSLLAFPFILFLHTLGLAMLGGTSVAIDVWLLRERVFARRISMTGFLRVMWLGLGVNALSGFLLLIAYPAKALTDPVFYGKLVLVGLAVFAVARINSEVFPNGHASAGAPITSTAKRWAAASLLLWAGTTLAGRLLAYTASVLLAADLQ